MCDLSRVGVKRTVVQNVCWPWNPVIYAINHPTSFDPCMIYDLLRAPTILITRLVFGLPIIGRVIRECGFIGVEPVGVGEHHDKSAYCSALNCLLKGRSILIAPTGKLSDEGKAKTGTVRLSTQSKAPVIPIGLTYKGTKRHFAIRGQEVIWIPFGDLLVRFGEPMNFPIYGNTHVDTEILMREINKLVGQ